MSSAHNANRKANKCKKQLRVSIKKLFGDEWYSLKNVHLQIKASINDMPQLALVRLWTVRKVITLAMSKYQVKKKKKLYTKIAKKGFNVFLLVNITLGEINSLFCS